MGSSHMAITLLSAEQFCCDAHEYREEAFNVMQQLFSSCELTGGEIPNPTYPNIVSLDLIRPFNELAMYTNNLRELVAPRELCVQKALELISSRNDYELNLALFRMELMHEVLAELGEEDVSALIKGIRCICDFLLAHFDNYTQTQSELFPYEFYRLHNERYLFLVKVSLDTDITALRPALIVKPAYVGNNVQTPEPVDNVAQREQYVIF